MSVATDRDVIEALAAIVVHAGEIDHHRTESERLLKSIEAKLLGRTYYRDGLGRQKGDYKITRLSIGWDGSIEVAGLKLLAGDRGEGNQLWELGTFSLKRLR